MKIANNYPPQTPVQDQVMLRYVKDHVSLMVETAKDFAIIAFDIERKVRIWNPGAERMFGYKPEEIIGKLGILIFTPEDRQHQIHEHEFEVATKTGKSEDERWHLRKDGSRLFVSGVLMAMRNERGNLLGYTKIVRDITVFKHMQEMLVEARDKAVAANAAKTEFIATISHEIRTPMNTIVGLSDILAKSYPLTMQQREYIETLHSSAGFLTSLINNLLDISQIEARMLQLERVTFSLTKIVEEVISMLSPKAQEKHLTLTMETECVKGCVFQGDPTRVRQIILNLCSNAVKFTDKGGINVHITSQHTDREGIEDVCITVKDTGIGIAAAKLSLIFDRFVQAESSTARKYGGTGLGLAITKHLAELMGGTITVDSDIGKGTTFTVCLPLLLGAS